MDTHYKYLLGSIVLVVYCNPVPGFYLFRKSAVMDLPNQEKHICTDMNSFMTIYSFQVKRRVALEDSDEDSCTSMNKENVSESAEMTIKDPQFDDNSMSATQRGVRSLMDSDDESVASQNQEEEKKSLTPHRRVRPVTDSDDSDSEQATGVRNRIARFSEMFPLLNVFFPRRFSFFIYRHLPMHMHFSF